MKITEVRTRVVQWEGETVPFPPHFCTNPMDLVAFREASMGNFAFHGWVLVEIFTDSGHVGLGNAALSPMVTKSLIDTYLKPLLIGADPWDTEFLWQQMYRRTMAFGRKGVAMTAISAVDIALWDLLGQERETAGIPPARWTNKGQDSGIRQPPVCHAHPRAPGRSRAIQGRRLQSHETAIRMGPHRRRRGNAEEC